MYSCKTGPFKMTFAHNAKFCIDIITTTVTTIIIVFSIICFIIAVAISNQIKWSIASQIFIAYTIMAVVSVYVRSTAISIKIAICSIYCINAIAKCNQPDMLKWTTFMKMIYLLYTIFQHWRELTCMKNQ